MELAFIISAIRRYSWVVILLAVLGAVPGVLSGGGATTYASHGALLVSPPADIAQTYAGDADRYVVGQLRVLRSTELADSVAEDVGNTTGAVVSSLVRFEHETKTDIVDVIAETGDPEFSKRIVDAYLDAYVGLIESQIAATVQPIDESIAEVRSQLDGVNEQIRQAMQPYLDAEPASPGDAFPPIPGIDQVAPSLATQQSLLQGSLLTLLNERAAVQTDTTRSVSGTIVQPGTLPTAAETESSIVAVAIGIVAGAFAGLLVAVLVARLSPRVLDDVQAEEILGQPVVGTFPRDRALAADRRLALEDPPTAVMPFVDSLSVRAEAGGRGEVLTVLVVGSQRAAGATTLASVLANGFAGNGASVLLVDADQQRPVLTSLFSGPLPARPTTRRRTAKPPRKLLKGVKATTVPNLRVANFGSSLSSSTMRRRHVGEGLEEARGQADVVVLDGGPLMASSSTLELARTCDAVVLVIPRHQKVRPLVTIAGELSPRPFLPVWSNTRPRLRTRIWTRLRHPFGGGGGTDVDLETERDEEDAEPAPRPTRSAAANGSAQIFDGADDVDTAPAPVSNEPETSKP